jgi:hypothetical protein
MKKWGGLNYDTLYSSNLCININCCKKGCQIPNSTFNRQKEKWKNSPMKTMLSWFVGFSQKEKVKNIIPSCGKLIVHDDRLNPRRLYILMGSFQQSIVGQFLYKWIKWNRRLLTLLKKLVRTSYYHMQYGLHVQF